jgi:hypothetical protein
MDAVTHASKAQPATQNLLPKGNALFTNYINKHLAHLTFKEVYVHINKNMSFSLDDRVKLLRGVLEGK